MRYTEQTVSSFTNYSATRFNTRELHGNADGANTLVTTATGTKFEVLLREWRWHMQCYHGDGMAICGSTRG